MNPLVPRNSPPPAGVSRETLARLKAYVGLLTDWNARHNLVSKGSLADVWRRHIWDSAQLAPLIPGDAKTLVDLGSGAGFPGLVLALLLQGRAAVTSVRSHQPRNANSFRPPPPGMEVSVEIRNSRMEDGAARSL